MPTTIKEVADEADVSVATVSHVINGTRYVSPELTERVQDAIDKLDYRTNAVARSLKTTKTRTVGLIVSDITNPFFSSMVRGVEDALMEQNHGMLIFNTDESRARESLAVEVLQERQMDGFIIAPSGKQSEIFSSLASKGVPFVFVDRKLNQVPCDCVLSENKSGAYKATQHLLELGHRSIGVISGIEEVSTTNERTMGFKQAIEGSSLASLKDQSILPGGSEVDQSREAAKSLLSTKDISAIFATSNVMTIGAIQAITRTGLSCPEDISLVGFDDFVWASSFRPTLTVVDQKPYKMGQEATDLLFDRLENDESTTEPREVRLSTNLIVRESTRSIK